MELVSGVVWMMSSKVRAGGQKDRRPLSGEGKSGREDGLRDQTAADSPPLPLKIGTGWGVGLKWQIKERFLRSWQSQWSFVTPAIHLRKSPEARK